MAQTVLCQVTRSHWDDEDEWNPIHSGEGKDTHVFNVPQGWKYARYEMDLEVASVGSGCIVEYWPDPGATGDQIVRVRWWYNPLGKIRYTLTIYTGDAETIPVIHGEANWGGKALGAIRQDQGLNLFIRGPLAKRLFRRLVRMSGKPMPVDTESETMTYPVPHDVALGLIGSIKYGAFGGIVLFGIDSGFQVKASFNPHGMFPFDDELCLEMRKNAQSPKP